MHVVGICTTMPGLHSEIFTRGGKSGKVRIKRGQAYIGQENTNLQGCTLGSRGGVAKAPRAPSPPKCNPAYLLQLSQTVMI